MQRIDRSSREYAQASVRASVQGEPYNPTADAVEFAFTAESGRPTTWYPGGWDGTEPRPPGNAYIAHCLVGPGGTVELPAGTYTMWIRITDNPEIPVIPFGLLTIT